MKATSGSFCNNLLYTKNTCTSFPPFLLLIIILQFTWPYIQPLSKPPKNNTHTCIGACSILILHFHDTLWHFIVFLLVFSVDRTKWMQCNLNILHTNTHTYTYSHTKHFLLFFWEKIFESLPRVFYTAIFYVLREFITFLCFCRCYTSLCVFVCMCSYMYKPHLFPFHTLLFLQKAIDIDLGSWFASIWECRDKVLLMLTLSFIYVCVCFHGATKCLTHWNILKNYQHLSLITFCVTF